MKGKIVLFLVLICHLGPLAKTESPPKDELQCYQCTREVDGADCENSPAEKFAKPCIKNDPKIKAYCHLKINGTSIVRDCVLGKGIKTGCETRSDGIKTCTCDTPLCNKEYKSEDGTKSPVGNPPGNSPAGTGDSGTRHLTYSGGLMGAAILFFFYRNI